jgi:hypothetical protein
MQSSEFQGLVHSAINTAGEMGTLAAVPYALDIVQQFKALESKLEAERISHPTDICECRFDCSDGVLKVRKQCDYHKRIADRLETLRKETDDELAEAAKAQHRTDDYARGLQSRLDASEQERNMLRKAVQCTSAEIYLQEQLRQSQSRLDSRALLLREIVAYFDVLHSKYRIDRTLCDLDQEWPYDWLRRVLEDLSPAVVESPRQRCEVPGCIGEKGPNHTTHVDKDYQPIVVERQLPETRAAVRHREDDGDGK